MKSLIKALLLFAIAFVVAYVVLLIIAAILEAVGVDAAANVVQEFAWIIALLAGLVYAWGGYSGTPL